MNDPKHRRLTLPLALLTLVGLASSVFILKPTPPSTSATPSPDQSTTILPSLTASKSSPPNPNHTPPSLLAPPPLTPLIDAIATGRPIVFSIPDTPDSKPILFRPTTITGEHFQATLGTGSHHLDIESLAVFTGRSLLGSQRASLAIVNGQLAAHLRAENGDIFHFRSNPETGTIESFLEQSLDSICAIDPNTNIATTQSRDTPPADPWSSAVPASIEPEPEIAASSGYNPANGNLQFTNRPIPYGRLYDQSLKDVLVLVVLDKSATGNDTSANLSSKTATYLSNMSSISAMYEHNLGLRIIVQELILTPNTTSYTDVANGTGLLVDFRSWVSSNRSRGTYGWTMAAKFGAVDGSGVLGIAYVGAAAGSSGVSINKTGNLTVPAHEMGHNMGSNHSNGGVMNPSANSSRDFFRNLESQTRTSAWAIYNYMSNGGANTQSRAFPSNRRLRHAEEIPFASDDSITTQPNQAIRFRPMANDATSVLNGAENQLTLVEAGAIFPPGAGEAWVYGDEIEFRPAPGFTNTAWLSYTIRGSAGRWLHKGDVAIRIDGSGTTPPTLTTTTATPDFIHHSGSSPLVINPLIDDHGPGHLNVSQVTPTLGVSGTSTPLNNGFLIANASLLDPTQGTLASNRVDITLSGGSRVDLTRFLTFTPSAGASGPARIQYTVADGSGSQTTQTATVLFGIDEVLLDAPAPARYKIPTDASDEFSWFQTLADNGSWTSGNTGIGYETNTSGTLYHPVIESDTRTEMFNGANSIYIHIPFEVSDPSALQALRLEIQYDDGFAAFINGVPAISRNAPSPLTWNGVATAGHEAQINSFTSLDISSAIPSLRSGTNLLAIQGFNDGNSSSDFIIRPRIVAVSKFTLGGINLPREINIPSGVGLILNGFLRGIDAPPFANAATVHWSSTTGDVIFADPTLPNTTASFPKPGIHTLRLRIAESGYVEEHQINVAVGTPTNNPGPLPITDPDLIIAADAASLQLNSIVTNADFSTWQAISGPSATIEPDGSIDFTTTGTHVFRLTATKGNLTTFDDIQIVRGSGIINVAPPGSLARHLVPTSAAPLTDSEGNNWHTREFDDAFWPHTPAIYGFERDAGYQSLYQVDLQSAMFNTNSTLLTRIPFFSPVASSLTLSIRYEDGFAAFLNGNNSANSNSATPPLAWDANATSSQSDSAAIIPESFPAGTTTPGTNVFAIQGLNSSATSSDFLLIPELTQLATADTPFLAQLITPQSSGKFLIPTTPETNWNNLSFNDDTWNQTAAAIGYERSNSDPFDQHFFTDIESFSFDQNQTVYLRIPFIIPTGFTIHSLSLRAKYDDAFVAHINGTEAIRSNITGSPVWNSGATSSRTESLATIFQSFDLSPSIPSLQPGSNLLAIQLLNFGLTSSDLLFVPELIAELEPNNSSPFDQWFNSIPGTSGLDSSPQADLDSDGLSNLLEFAFGGNPISANLFNQPPIPSFNGNQFTFHRRLDHSSADLTYQIETTSDLTTDLWTPVNTTQELTSASNIPGIEIVSATLPATAQRRFYRLRVSLN